MSDIFFHILYIATAAGLSVWLWLVRPWLAERGWLTLHAWALSLSVGAGVVAVGLVPDLLNGKDAPSLGLFFAGIFIVGMIFNLFRNGWSWFAEKAGIPGFGFGRNPHEHIRGAALADERTVSKRLKHSQSRFSVGAVPVPVELETRGFLLVGSPGTGKSQTLTHALDALRADGQRAVIADASGIYTSRYYYDKRGDVILNPFDSRSVAWSPLSEIETVADIPAMCKSLIPDAEGEGRVWSGYAQNALDAILEYCFTGGLNNAEIFRLVAVADNEELREIFAGTPAQPLVAEGNEKMFASVRGSMTDALSAIRYLDPSADASSFSIRRHISEERPGWIFLSYQQQHRDALKSMIACCVDVASRAVLSLPPSHDRRVVFGLDELPLLGKIQSIVDLATNGRKHGAVIFAGLQTVAQIREAYGNETAQTLLACLGSWLVLRVSDAETAEYMSRFLGEEEKTRIVKSGGESSQSMQLGGSKSDNWQEQVVKDRVVLPSELQALPDLRGIFNLAGPVPSAVVNLQIAAQRKEAEAFVAAPPRVRVKPQVKQPEQKQAGGTDRAQAAEADMLDLL